MRKDIRMDLGIRKTVLDNGLTILTCPMPEKSSAFALFGTKFGSVDQHFMLDGREITVPSGTAHFLEHKLFENEDSDAFKLFARTGASSNAYTSYDRTCFVFQATDGFYDSLRILLSFVREPYFTKETIDKEQGIISEEIRMYSDSPVWQLLAGVLGLVYEKHPIREDIAGTEESIGRITPEMLYDCYNAFYTPDNMVLSIAGKFDEEKTIEICREALSDMKRRDSKKLPVREGCEVAVRSGSREMSVAMKQFSYAYKEKAFPVEKQYMSELYLEILLYIMAGSTSRLYGELYDDGLINSSFGFEILEGDDFMSVIFSGDSRDPEETVRRIEKAIEGFKRNGIPNVRVEEVRRLLLGDTVCCMDEPEAAASEMAAAYFKKGSVYDKISAVCAVNRQDLEKMLSEHFDSSKAALFIINPKESK
ncbi:MAG: insulinase family protein [Oscillospiraceae bacterium]|nr:insulinase family protein [Oscillospiraceae bacterium]